MPIARFLDISDEFLITLCIRMVCDRRGRVKICSMVNTVAEEKTEFIFHFSLLWGSACQTTNKRDLYYEKRNEDFSPCTIVFTYQ